MALGTSANASNFGISLGKSSAASGTKGIAVGTSSQATNLSAVAIGTGCLLCGKYDEVQICFSVGVCCRFFILGAVLDYP